MTRPLQPNVTPKRYRVPVSRTQLYRGDSQMIRQDILDWLTDYTLGQWSLIRHRTGPVMWFEKQVDQQVFQMFWT